MKTATFTHPTHRFIDTAPLAARYEVLAEAVLAFVMAGRLGHALRTSRKILHLVRTLSKLEAHNVHLKRKLDMLSHTAWREAVLKQLGGMRTLKLWEAAQKRIMARIDARAEGPAAPAAPQEPAWLHTPERMAESERLKARARNCARASAQPLIFRDRIKMDFDGLFRLAPLPRGERAKPQVKVYTQATISNYVFNAIPFGEAEGFGPAEVWPVEFYAAMKIETEILERREKNAAPSSISVIPAKPQSGEELGPNPTEQPSRLGPASASVVFANKTTNSVRDDKGTSISTLTLRDVLPDKIYHAIFDP